MNRLLAEIDGVAGQREVFVIGATNRPDPIDPAMLRGGRLSRSIVLGLPDEDGRLAILEADRHRRHPGGGEAEDRDASPTEGSRRRT